LKSAALIVSIVIAASGILYAGPANVPVGNPLTDRLWLLAREMYGRELLNDYEYNRLNSLNQDMYGSRHDHLIGAYNNLYAGSTDIDNAFIKTGAGLISSLKRDDNKNLNFFKLFPYLKIQFNDKIRLNTIYRVDPEADNDPRYDGKSWGGIAGFAEYAMIDYSGENLKAGFGLKRLSWGYGSTGNLIFDKNSMPMTNFYIGYKRSIFNYEFIAGFLSPLAGEIDSSEYNVDFFPETQRYLSAHSLTIRPSDCFSISLRESVIYGGPGRRFELAYSFPMIWYHGYQLNSRIDDNTLFSFGVDYRYRGRLWLYGELLIDDFQVEKKTRGDYEPDEIGFIVGGEFYDVPITRSTIAFEYARINNRTYNQGRPHNRYINRNMPIGYQSGPDSDLLEGRLSYWLHEELKITLTSQYSRKGEGRIDADWSTPWLDIDKYSEPFPTGVIEKTSSSSLSITYIGNNYTWGNFEIRYSDVKNRYNQSGMNKSEWLIFLELGLNFSIEVAH